MMRGINVSSLLRLDNMLWSQKHHTVILKETNLSDQEDIISPYHTIHDQFEEAVKISMGCEPSDLLYPACLKEYLGLLSADEWVDKRRITNHSVIKSPSERLHRNLRVNHLLRREFVYHGRRRTEGTAARAVLEKLGEIFPPELFTAEGLNPMMDYWARKAQVMRGGPLSDSPVSWPRSPSGEDLPEEDRNLYQGGLLVALCRDPFEHPYGPSADRVPGVPRFYTLMQVENLVDAIAPLYGLTLEKYFMTHGIWRYLEFGWRQKPSYMYWTDWPPSKPPQADNNNEKESAPKVVGLLGAATET